MAARPDQEREQSPHFLQNDLLPRQPQSEPDAKRRKCRRRQPAIDLNRMFDDKVAILGPLEQRDENSAGKPKQNNVPPQARLWAFRRSAPCREKCRENSRSVALCKAIPQNGRTVLADGDECWVKKCMSGSLRQLTVVHI